MGDTITRRYFLVLAAAIGAAALCCCSALEADPPPLPLEATASGDALTARPAGVLAASLDGVPGVVGLQRVWHAATGCFDRSDANGDGLVDGIGSIMAWPTTRFPRAGERCDTAWTIGALPPHVELPVLLLFSFERGPGIDLTSFGWQGCVYGLPTEPGRVFAMAPDGALLEQQGGVVRLSWTPAGWQVGRRVYLQLVAWRPGANKAGQLLSPMVDILVGNLLP